MPEVTLKELFKSPWGIVERRRVEIEQSPNGGFDRILKEEMDRQFLTAPKVAELMDCSETTARRWLRQLQSRYIVKDSVTRHLREDVEKVAAKRKALLDEQKRRRDAKKIKSAA